jgi:hypothetical protein
MRPNEGHPALAAPLQPASVKTVGRVPRAARCRDDVTSGRNSIHAPYVLQEPKSFQRVRASSNHAGTKNDCEPVNHIAVQFHREPCSRGAIAPNAHKTDKPESLRDNSFFKVLRNGVRYLAKLKACQRGVRQKDA